LIGRLIGPAAEMRGRIIIEIDRRHLQYIETWNQEDRETRAQNEQPIKNDESDPSETA